MNPRRPVILALTFALILPLPLLAASPTFERVADTGDAVPGGEPGETFADLQLLALVSGDCAAFAGVGDMGSEGIYLWGLGAGLQVVADLDTPVPGGGPGDAFTTLDELSIDACDVAYSAVINGTDTAIFRKSPGGATQRVVDTSTAVPGEPGETFGEIESVWLHFGDMAFVGRHGSCAGTPQEVAGIYLYDGAIQEVTAAADTCSTPVPGGSATEIFSELGDGPPILDAFNVAFTGLGALGSEGIYSTLGGPLRLVADLATDLPGGQPGEGFDDFSDVVPISGGEIVFLAAGTMGTVGIFRETGAGIELLYDVSEAPPGWQPGEVFDFATYEDEALFCWHSGGVTTFYGIGDMGSEGIYRTGGTEVTELIAVGDLLDGSTVTGLFFVTHAKSERVVFVAELDGTTQAVYVAREALFEDGFESGDLTGWGSRSVRQPPHRAAVGQGEANFRRERRGLDISSDSVSSQVSRISGGGEPRRGVSP